MKKAWLFSFNFLLNSAIAFAAPFIVLFYQELGFSGTQIGLLTGIIPLITLVSAPLWTGFADRTNRHRLVMSLVILGSVGTVAAFPFQSSFALVFAVAVLLFIFVSPVNPMADSTTMFMLANEKEQYSRIRLGGALGYGIGAFISGLIVQNYGLRFTFWGSAVLLFLGLLVSKKLSWGQMAPDSPDRGSARTLLTNPRWVLFLVVAFAGGMGMTVYTNYLFPYMKELGASESMMGIAITVGMISEIPVLFFGNRLIKRFKAYGVLMLGMVFIGVRMLLWAAVSTPGLALGIQLLHGLTLPLMLVAGVTYADENAPSGMSATAQGLFYAMVSGVGAAVGGFVGGLLLEMIGGRGMFLVFGTAVLVIVGIAELIRRRLPAEEASPSVG